MAVIALVRVTEGERRAVSNDAHRSIELEGEQRFRVDDGGLAASEQHADQTGGGSGTGSDSSAPAITCARSDDGSERSGGADCADVTADRTLAIVGDNLGADADLLAIDKGDANEFDAQVGIAIDATRFQSIGDAATNGLAALCDDNAINDDRFGEGGEKCLALLALI